MSTSGLVPNFEGAHRVGGLALPKKVGLVC